MRAKFDRSGCISCGLCAETYPDVFRMADDGVALRPCSAIVEKQKSTGSPNELRTLGGCQFVP